MAYYTDQRKYFDELYMHGNKKKILLEGDSWFSIPDIANIPIQLDSLLDLSILCLADPGDTLEEISEGAQFKNLENLIKDNRYGQKWDALMFSAGGNDVIGPEIKGLLRKSEVIESVDPNDHLDPKAVKETFRQIRKRFIALKRLRDKSKINSDTPIFIHTYSYLTPRNIAHKAFVWNVAGPWIFPYMTAMGITDCAAQSNIVAFLLDKFWTTLQGIAEEPDSNFFVIDTRKSLTPVACVDRNTSFEYWRDEIHPTSRGFSVITKAFVIPAMQKVGVV
ncbi:MAG: hypothetical protein JSR53_00125 [Proteobacteria bacterium]|nr:hypothetical protein [Pseudomonadota bacterium]